MWDLSSRKLFSSMVQHTGRINDLAVLQVGGAQKTRTDDVLPCLCISPLSDVHVHPWVAPIAAPRDGK